MSGSVRLVLAGNHEQYMHRAAELQSAGGGPVRPVREEHHLRGYDVREVTSFDLVGDYWDNPVWGSTAYQVFMAEGLHFDMPWAHPWPADWQRAEILRGRAPDPNAPLRPDELEAARAARRRIAELLDGIA